MNIFLSALLRQQRVSAALLFTLSILTFLIATSSANADISLIPNKKWFIDAHYGLFATYSLGNSNSPQTVYFDGTAPQSLDDLADDFNEVKFARDLHGFHVDYVIFTGMPHAGDLFYPSDAVGQSKVGQSSKRDVIGALIAALRPFDIKLILDISVTDGDLLTTREQKLSGWIDTTGAYTVWNNYKNSELTEMGLRYAAGIAGYWIDAPAVPADFAKIDQDRLRQSLLAGDPDRVILGCFDPGETSTLFDTEFAHAPLTASLDQWPAERYGEATTISASTPWASVNQGTNELKFMPNDLFEYIVLEASVNTAGGGVVFKAGPFAGAEGGWEDGIADGLKTIGKQLRPIGESLEATTISTDYPTSPGTTLASLSSGFVATDSKDGKYEYIHILKPPNSDTVTLPAPANNTNFLSAELTRNHHLVKLQQSTAGVMLTLTPTDSWDPSDTVIRLRK